MTFPPQREIHCLFHTNFFFLTNKVMLFWHERLDIKNQTKTKKNSNENFQKNVEFFVTISRSYQMQTN